MSRKSKVDMPKDKLDKCHKIIHTATAAAGAAGAIPIPLSDAIPITAAQIAMVVSLGKVFDITIGRSAAKAILGVGVTTGVGRTLVVNALKCIPGAGSVAGGIIGATTAVAITEGLGWLVADDFFRIANGEEPEDITDAAGSILGHYKK